jgi:hypothetical protein
VVIKTLPQSDQKGQPGELLAAVAHLRRLGLSLCRILPAASFPDQPSLFEGLG